MANHIALIVRREYLERVRRKSFIITTILMPLLMIALMALPALVMALSGPEDKTIAVVDNSGIVAQHLVSEGEIHYQPVTEPADSAKNNEDYDGVLVIGADIIGNSDNVSLFTHENVSMTTEAAISGEISRILEQQKLKRYDIENLDRILEDVQTNVKVRTFSLEDGGEQATSSFASYIIGMIMTMILYMFILMYGQMVMSSIIEEKNNRVLEIVVSSVNPTRLMLGKILGIGSVALTQILIWGVLLFAFSSWGLPAIMGGVPAAEAGTDGAEVMEIVNGVFAPGYILSLFGYMALFLIGGFLLYSSIYAAIGSAVDNIQDASQLSSFATVPIIIALVASMTVINEPNSTLAVWLSMIPFTSPMVMMMRIPYGVSTLEIIMSLAILLATVLFTVWIAAKIYRVGIFMYGKKPTVKDLVRWARYK